MVEKKIKEILKRAFPQEFEEKRFEQYKELGIQKPVIKSFEEQKKLNEALLEASREGNVEKVQELINNGANPNAHDKHRWTALHLASLNGHDEIVKLLLEKGAKINAKNKYDETALHNASYNGHDKTVRLLLEKRADIHAKDDEWRTALHNASLNGHGEIVKLLLEHAEKHGGIEKLLNAVNNRGERAVDIAKHNVRGVLIEEMRKHGLKI